jgi:dienelactone hydrolase
MTRFPLALLALLPLVLVAPAQQPKADYAANRKQLDRYFRDQTKRINDACLAGLTTRADWEKKRPELRRQFLDMMGLDPLPPRTPLNPVVTGTFTAGAVTVERIHFQSMPGLYVTANLYLPANRPAGARLPTILYVCGHGNVVIDGVSFGSKVHYQYHPTWFASNGYACLILDTVELGEIRGDHHGTHGAKMWWWQGRGYTPAGVELWNAMRALDYLDTRPEVDPRRIGLTGRSGGGATSWWVAAADERIRAVVPVAGIADLHAHLNEAPAPRLADGVVAGHCDCMYMVNTYRWDFAQVAALIAPRPLLLGNSDKDDIFPVEGYRRLADKARKVYDLYGAADRFRLLETKGPHSDTPELHAGINAWMARWLKNDPSPQAAPDLAKRFEPRQLKVFDKLPEPRRNEAIHDTFVPAAAFDPPADPAAATAWWADRQPKLKAVLASHVFGGWAKAPPPLNATVAADVTREGLRLRAIEFVSEDHVPLRLWLATAAGATPKDVLLRVLDDAGYEDWCAALGPGFAAALQHPGKPERNDAAFAALKSSRTAVAAVAPRGVGPTRWAEPGSKEDTHIRRRFPLIGQTLDGQRVWDVTRAAAAVRVPDLAGAKLTLHGRGGAAGLALYAAVFGPPADLDLIDLPVTHRAGPVLLNVQRYTDVPEVLALAAAGRTVTLALPAGSDPAAWAAARRVAGPGLAVAVSGR